MTKALVERLTAMLDLSTLPAKFRMYLATLFLPLSEYPRGYRRRS
ncbi:hypothetical protein PIIN_11500 [Serendipita indica DSM 11827]|uniref:Uncharacterized protein n=1 Tax=Serendipita indica (strain DSM 11827) TaxID=1109443 RepID=G4U1T0_SERID|nr:hypothetical protein PIIN_11500 [Serendipita indica DSM 11827]